MADQTSNATPKPANVINVKLSDMGKEMTEMAAGLENANLSRLLRSALCREVQRILAENDLLTPEYEAELSRGMKEPKASE